jgi:hypothetical protein
MKRFKRGLLIFIPLTLLAIAAAGATYAAFTDRGTVAGSSFSVGSGDIKLLESLTAGIGEENLKDEMAGPGFENIGPNWEEAYLLKIYNNATTDINLTSNANYETTNDPEELRQLIYVEPIEWDDVNQDGILDSDETGDSLGRKTIVKWKTEGYDLGQVPQGTVKSLILKFSTDEVSNTKQGAGAVFDFEFDAIQL